MPKVEQIGTINSPAFYLYVTSRLIIIGANVN